MPRPIVTLACSVAGLGIVAGALAGPAAAAGPVSNPSLHLITKSQVGVNKGVWGPWSHTPVIKGQYVQEDCATAAFPKAGTLHRAVYNDLQGNAINQYAVKLPTVAAAKKLTSKVKYCFSRSRDERLTAGAVGMKTTYRTWGDYKVADGMLVRTQHTVYSEHPGQSLMSTVGRDGRVVMAMWWTLYDTKSYGPRDMWTALSKKALTQLQ